MNNGWFFSIFFQFYLLILFIKLSEADDQVTNCQQNYYFDTTLQECKACAFNSESDGKSACECKMGFINNFNITNNLLQTDIVTQRCLQCPTNSTSSLDKSICIKCSNRTDASGECHCNSNEIIVEKDISGNYLSEKQCLACPNNTFISSVQPAYACMACPVGTKWDNNTVPWGCSCDLTNYIASGDECLPIKDVSFITSNYPPNVAKGLGFSQAETSDPLVDAQITIASSDTIDYLYLKNAYKCLREFENTSCQVLANLCVIQLYDLNNPICKLYQYIMNLRPQVIGSTDPGFKQGLPWLYYKNTADKVINDTQRISFQVSFDPNDQVLVNQLEFYLRKYDIYGNYLGEELLNTQLQLCSKTNEDGIYFRSFGTTIVNECNIDLNSYVARNNTMYFYEIFLKDPQNSIYIDIPILIDNIPNSKASGSGNLNNATQPVDWILVRRFFLIDNLSALQNLNEFKRASGQPFAIRFPKLIKLIVLLQNTEGSKIMTPYFEILYKAQSLSLIESSGKTAISFISEYRMDIESFLNTAGSILIILNILIGITVIVRMYVWYKLNPPTLSPDNYLLWFIWTFFLKYFEWWGKVMFWFCWIISAYWYIFFKLQYRVFVLLPPLNTWYENYRAFDIIHGIACACYTFHLFNKVYEQSNIDIFFIDWEHDKELLIKNANELRTEKYRGAWRLVSVANQFNRLMNERYISLPFCFCWLVFAWWYLDWGNYTNHIPSKTLSVNSPNNYILMHFLGSFVLILCGIGHFIIWAAIQFAIPLKKDDFIDLCCVANTSVFILDQSLHGYYIHGQSPAGKSDTNLDELLRFLDEEGTGKAKGRGLVDKDPDNLQTYELFISYKMRISYDGIFGLQTETMINSAQSRDKLHNQSRIVNFIKALPKSLQHDKIYKLKSYMNNELKERIQNISNQPTKYVREKTNLQRFLNYPPMELIGNTPDEIVFFKDPSNNWESVLFSGIEWEWYVWNIFVFQMWMLTLDSCAISIFLTYICDKLLFNARSFWCEKNLARKAIIDNKFFM